MTAAGPIMVMRRRRTGGGGGGAADAWAIGGASPELVVSYTKAEDGTTDGEYFRAGGVATTSAVVTSTVPGLRTMYNSSGNLVWNPHNLAINSATPATQSITVVSGADYTVEITGSGSVTLSGAGSGTVTAGSPVEITASTTTLTLTVSGSPSTMWAYRSDLGGMAVNPDTGTTYVATAGSPVYLPRRNAYRYNGTSWVLGGMQVETAAATNLLLNSATLSTQNVTVTAAAHTLSFTGTGTVTLSGVSTAGPLVGTGTGNENRVSLTFTPTAGTLTLTVSGTVSTAQLEVGSTPSSYIPTTGATVTRAAETHTVAGTDHGVGTGGFSVALDMFVTDNPNAAPNARMLHWYISGGVRMSVMSSGATFGAINSYTPLGASSVAAGTTVPDRFQIAARFGASDVVAACNGNIDATPGSARVAGDFSTVPMQIARYETSGVETHGFISAVRIWQSELDNAGLLEAAP